MVDGVRKHASGGASSGSGAPPPPAKRAKGQRDLLPRGGPVPFNINPGAERPSVEERDLRDVLNRKKVLFVVNRLTCQVKYVVTNAAGGYYTSVMVEGQGGAAGTSASAKVHLQEWVPGTQNKAQEGYLPGATEQAVNGVVVPFTDVAHVTVLFPIFGADDTQEEHPTYDPAFGQHSTVDKDGFCIEVIYLPKRQRV